jgi:hypothetical protein
MLKDKLKKEIDKSDDYANNINRLNEDVDKANDK